MLRKLKHGNAINTFQPQTVKTQKIHLSELAFHNWAAFSRVALSRHLFTCFSFRTCVLPSFLPALLPQLQQEAALPASRGVSSLSRQPQPERAA